MNKNVIVFDSVVIDQNDKTFTIMDGTIGTYSLEQIEKCSVLGESAKYKGKSELFTHTVITGIGVVSAPLFEPGFYVGLKINMKNKDVIAIYVSKKEVRMNTDAYFADMEVANRIKKIMDHKGIITLNQKDKNIEQVKDSGKKLKILHKDMVSFWKGKTIFMMVALLAGIMISVYNIPFKKIFPLVGGKEQLATIIENAVYKLDELESFDVVNESSNVTVHIENDEKGNGYTASYCGSERCNTYRYTEDHSFILNGGKEVEMIPERVVQEEPIPYYEIRNIDEFVGKIQYQYDILGDLPNYFTEDLITVDEQGRHFSYDDPKDGMNRYYHENYKLVKGSTVWTYTTEGRLYVDNETETQLDDYVPYEVEIQIDIDGYLRSAKLTFREDVYAEAYHYRFTSFEK